MALNLSSLSQVASGATSVNNIIAVVPAIFGGTNTGITPAPIVTPGGTVLNKQPSFLFHYEGENKVSLKCEITDHYIENNTAIQDQIAITPAIISTHGFIGELNNVPPFGAIGAALKTAVDKLGPGLATWAPGTTKTMQNNYNQAVQATQVGQSVYNNAKALTDTLSGNPVQGAQASAYLKFQSWMAQRTLFNVQTPWCVFQNMAILDLEATQDETTAMITDFFITFKQINFANSLTGGTLTYGSQLYNANGSPVVNAAPQTGDPTNPGLSGSPLYGKTGLTPTNAV